MMRMTPRERNEMPLEDFYNSKEANRVSLLQSIAATNKKINDQLIKDRPKSRPENDDEE